MSFAIKRLAFVKISTVAFAILTAASAMAGDYQFPTSSLGYTLPMPFSRLSTTTQSALKERLPLDAIGAVLLEAPPFRATTVYLGSINHRYLFAIAGHVAVGSHPYGVEFGQLSGTKIKVPLDEVPVVSSMEADWAIYQSSRPQFVDATGLQGLNAFAKSGIRPIRVSFTPIGNLLNSYPDAKFYVAGRAKYAVYLSESGPAPDGVPGLWPTSSSDPQGVYAAWTDPKTVAEAANNVDEAGPKAGDIFAVADIRIPSGGTLAFLKDPDGLTANQSGGSPFLSSGIYWNPLSMAISTHLLGRMSGSPIMMATGPNRDDVVMVASYWTAGIPQAIQPLLKQIQAGDTASAFGGIQPLTHSAYGISKAVTIQNGQLFMPVGEAAPLDYVSALSAAIPGNSADSFFSKIQKLQTPR